MNSDEECPEAVGPWYKDSPQIFTGKDKLNLSEGETSIALVATMKNR